MKRPPLDDPFNPTPGHCDACGHPPHAGIDCPFHYPLDKCPGYRAVPMSMEVIHEAFARMRPQQEADKRSREFFAKDFTYLKEEW